MIVCVSKQAGRIFIGMKKKKIFFFYVYDALTVAHHVPIGKIIKILRKKRKKKKLKFTTRIKRKRRAPPARGHLKKKRVQRRTDRRRNVYTQIYIYIAFLPLWFITYHLRIESFLCWNEYYYSDR